MEKCYVSERVTNIAELERIIEQCYLLAICLKNENPDNENSHKLIELLMKAYNFEFEVERRKTSYCE